MARKHKYQLTASVKRGRSSVTAQAVTKGSWLSWLGIRWGFRLAADWIAVALLALKIRRRRRRLPGWLALWIVTPPADRP